MAIHQIVLGTAGHIDHGKSSLVRALTGIDPDRLREEKERGLTIDLGFAPWDLPGGKRIGFVDVPGHERFIKNMVAGASGIDLVILVVAADDGVMLQTREHLDIMTLLGIRRGVVVLSKIDLVEAEYRELALEEISELVAGTFLEEAPVFSLSVVSGEGLEAFRTALQEIVLATPPRSSTGEFRMPIQRVFSARGFGTIVTGIPISGALRIGSGVEILPQRARARVRGLEAYREKVEEVRAGHSSAVNLSDVDYRSVKRGMVLAAPGVFKGGTMFEASFQLLERVGWPLKHLSEIRFHCGTSEVLGQIALMEGDLLEPGKESFVQLRLEEEVCAVPGDRFILRLATPMMTLGGGTILGRSLHRLKRTRPGVIEGMKRFEQALNDPAEALLVALEKRADRPVRSADLARDLHWQVGETRALLEELAVGGKTVKLAAGWVADSVLARESERIAAAIASYFDEHPHRLWVDLRELRARSGRSSAMLDAALAAMIQAGSLERREAGVRPIDRRVTLERDRQAIAQTALRALEDGGFQPPSPAQLAELCGVESADLTRLLETLQDLDQVVIVNPELVLSRAAIERAGEEITANIERNGELLIPELRDALQTSRKFLIPLLDFFDRSGLTVRQGGQRILRNRSRA